MSILRDVESKQKKITDFNYSSEGQSVAQNPSLKQHRLFTIDGKQKFVENHIKSLPSKHSTANGFCRYTLNPSHSNGRVFSAPVKTIFFGNCVKSCCMMFIDSIRPLSKVDFFSANTM
jgi:hypothetical protein